MSTIDKDMQRDFPTLKIGFLYSYVIKTTWSLKDEKGMFLFGQVHLGIVLRICG